MTKSQTWQILVASSIVLCLAPPPGAAKGYCNGDILEPSFGIPSGKIEGTSTRSNLPSTTIKRRPTQLVTTTLSNLNASMFNSYSWKRKVILFPEPPSVTPVHPVFRTTPAQAPHWPDISNEQMRRLNDSEPATKVDFNSCRYFEMTELKAACVILERMQGKTRAEIESAIGAPALKLGAGKGELPPAPADNESRYWYVLGTSPVFLFLDFQGDKCTGGSVSRFYRNDLYSHWRYLRAQTTAINKTPTEIIQLESYPDEIGTNKPPDCIIEKQDLDRYFAKTSFSGYISYFGNCDKPINFEFQDNKCVKVIEGWPFIRAGTFNRNESNATYIPVDEKSWKKYF